MTPITYITIYIHKHKPLIIKDYHNCGIGFAASQMILIA